MIFNFKSSNITANLWFFNLITSTHDLDGSHLADRAEEAGAHAKQTGAFLAFCLSLLFHTMFHLLS